MQILGWLRRRECGKCTEVRTGGPTGFGYMSFCVGFWAPRDRNAEAGLGRQGSGSALWCRATFCNDTSGVSPDFTSCSSNKDPETSTHTHTVNVYFDVLAFASSYLAVLLFMLGKHGLNK